MPEADSEQAARGAGQPANRRRDDGFPDRLKLVFLDWDGLIGGAELFTASLAGELRSRGVESTVIFVGHADQLEDRLRRDGTPFRSLRLRPGSRVLTHPRRLATAASCACPTESASPPASSRPRHPGPLRLGFVGRLVAGKGVDVLLRALALVCERAPRPTAALATVGDGPARASLERLAGSLGLDENVAFLGWTRDVAWFWATRDLAVAPNDRLVESFCLSVAEAMAAGRPAVVSALGALAELAVDAVTGLVVPPGDVEALARAIEHYRAAPDRLAGDGAAARAFAGENLSIERRADRYLSLLASLPVNAARIRSG